MLARLSLIRTCLLAVAVAVAIPGAAGAADAAADADTARVVGVMQARIRDLHDRLHITDVEQPQWDAVAAAMVANARHVAELHARFGDAAPLSAPADLRHYAAIAQAHAEDAERMIGPFDQLYQVMTPEQRTIADQTFRKFEQERIRKAGL